MEIRTIKYVNGKGNLFALETRSWYSSVENRHNECFIFPLNEGANEELLTLFNRFSLYDEEDTTVVQMNKNIFISAEWDEEEGIFNMAVEKLAFSYADDRSISKAPFKKVLYNLLGCHKA